MRAQQRIDVYLLYRALVGPQLTLRAYAARELGRQGSSESLPFLIDALTDESQHVGSSYPDPGMATTRYWANESLKKLTGEDFGFIWNAPRASRAEAVVKWRAWFASVDLAMPRQSPVSESYESWGRQKEFFSRGGF